MSLEELRAAQESEFGDLSAMAADDSRMMVDEEGVLRIVKHGDLAAVVPAALKDAVLHHVDGSRLTGHYRCRRTFARLRAAFGGKVGRNMSGNSSLSVCHVLLAKTGGPDAKPDWRLCTHSVGSSKWGSISRP